ncbi:MAG: pantoate--beta-alanine ligase, partial [Flavobacteriaceae bacterium]|nr:pantoate--beta-alanine ligase [Flavobacteriaceae bacterium]
MGIHTNRESLQRALAANRNGNTIGFVPTMGALHRGHLALVTQALQENTNVVVSIFVNPTQFDNPADLDRYPRTLEEDITLLHNLHQDIHIFVPTVQELYQDGIASRHFNFDGLDTEME